MKIFAKFRKSSVVLLSVAVAVAMLAAVIGALFYFGILHINNPLSEGYSVIGVDVSAYQGEIDWQTLSAQDISFAFIKATEGSSFVDSHFQDNFAQAQKTDLRIGAYHFFSFESSGKAQAEHFCATVPKVSGALPPVVDLEYYGEFGASNTDSEKIRAELRDFVDAVRDYYGASPIIYVTNSSYKNIIAEGFSDCTFWVRSVYGKPQGKPDWSFWQYSNRHVLKGYNGKERYIDMNVFCGSKAEFEEFGLGAADKQ
ncbi:MAG: hypothetical protein KBS52_07045 [Clostridiales bacterium]|nr:hypothetical protein [Candidatus Equinaster intestinalis]